MPPTSLPSFGLLIGPCLDIIWEYHSLLYEVARNAALVMDELVCVAGYLYEVLRIKRMRLALGRSMLSMDVQSYSDFNGGNFHLVREVILDQPTQPEQSTSHNFVEEKEEEGPEIKAIRARQAAELERIHRRLRAEPQPDFFSTSLPHYGSRSLDEFDRLHFYHEQKDLSDRIPESYLQRNSSSASTMSMTPSTSPILSQSPVFPARTSSRSSSSSSSPYQHPSGSSSVSIPASSRSSSATIPASSRSSPVTTPSPAHSSIPLAFSSRASSVPLPGSSRPSSVIHTPSRSSSVTFPPPSHLSSSLLHPSRVPRATPSPYAPSPRVPVSPASSGYSSMEYE